MANKYRVGTEGSETWLRIVQAAEAVIRDQGYAAASTRRVAQHAELKPSLVHYYFPTTDDLLLAVFKRGAAHSDAMIEAALASDDPLRELWRFFSDPSRTALSVEFIALANHRESVRTEIVRHSASMRERQATMIERMLGERCEEEGAAAGISLILAGIGRALVMEAELGIHDGHIEARRLVESWLDRLPPRAERLSAAT